MQNKSYQFYIYENWQAHGHIARIHRAECSFSNFGKGFHGTDNTEHGQWLGPFRTFENALSAAKETHAEVSTCKICSPEINYAE